LSDFARRRFEWLDQLVADREVTAAAFALGYVVSAHINRETGEAYPTQETLAGKVGLSVRSVRSLTDLLAARGHLQITESRGRGHSIRYRPIVKGHGTEQKEMFPEAAAPEANRTAAPNGARDASGGSRSKPPEDRSPKKANGRGAASADLDREFDEWWTQYPRRVARGAARKAYERALKSGKVTPVELVAGALRYGAERTGQEEQYTKHPATWLNNECWRDEPAEVGPPISDPRPRSSSWTETALKGFTDADE
jgi:hypothetical protein